MSSKPKSLVIVFGDEDFLVDREALRYRSAWKNRIVKLFDGDSVKEAEFVEYCDTQPLFDSGRAVFLDNAQDMSAGKLLASYLKRRDDSDLSTLVVVVYRGATLPDAWSDSGAKKISYPKLKAYQKDAVIARTVEEGKRLNLTLDVAAATTIYNFLGDNMRSTFNELTKLSYLAVDGHVTNEQVRSVIAPDIPAEPYQVSNFAFEKNANKAMGVTSLLYKYRGEGASVPIASALMRQAEMLLIAKQLTDKRESTGLIAERLKLNEYVYKKTYIPMLLRHDVPSLVGHMKNLSKLDAEVKGAARSKRTLVELAVLSIAS